jgi:hypothetical protein
MIKTHWYNNRKKAEPKPLVPEKICIECGESMPGYKYKYCSGKCTYAKYLREKRKK